MKITQKFHKFISLLKIILGTWTPPLWLSNFWKKLSTNIAGFRLKTKTAYQNNPKKFKINVVIALVLLGLVGSGVAWWVNRPQPVRISVSLDKPSPTPLEDNAEAYPLYINFGGSAAELSLIGKEVTEHVEINPQIQGVWKWESDTQLSFQPHGDWPLGQSYRIKMNRRLFPNHVHLETYTQEFVSPKFKAVLQSMEFYQDPKKPSLKKVVTTVTFSHPVDPKSFEQSIRMELSEGSNRDTKKFSVLYDKFFGKAFIHSENLKIPEKKSKMELWILKGVHSSKKGRGTDNELSNSVEIPGMYSYFSVNSVKLDFVRNKQYEPEQVLIVDVKDAINYKLIKNYLSVYVLPKEHTLRSGGKLRTFKNYNWSVQTVTKEVIAKSKAVKLKPIPIAHEFSKVLSYKYDIPPKSHLYIQIKNGLKSSGGYFLAETKAFVKRVAAFPKEINIMAEGSLLSLNGDKKTSILGRDLSDIRYTVTRILPGQLAHLVTQSNGNFSHPKFVHEYYYGDANFNADNIGEHEYYYDKFPYVGAGKSQYTNFDFSKVIDNSKSKPRGLFLFSVESWNPKRKKARSGGPKDSRLILVTDLGIIAKKSVDGSYRVFVQSIQNGQAVVGAKITVVGKNGLDVVSRTTNNEGVVNFSSLDDFEREKKPTAFVVTKGNDMSFLPIDKHVNSVNMSRFDVGGVYTEYQKAKLNAFMFSDRGIYRPGDSVNVGIVVKDKIWERPQHNTKLKLRIYNPKYNLVKQQILSLTKVGLQEYSFDTAADWPTGQYQMELHLYDPVRKRLKGQIASRSIKVEEFLPDTMRIVAKFSKIPNKGWIKPHDLKAMVELQNLFGTAAQNRRIKGEISLSPSYASFRAFKDYTFHDPLRSKKSYSELLNDQTTGDDGRAEFALDLEKYNSSSFMLRFLAEGFEAEGGRSVLASTSSLISPLDYLVAYKKNASLNYVKKGSQLAVEVIAVNPDLKKIDASTLTLRKLSFEKVSTLIKQKNGTYKYESVEKKTVESEKPFKIMQAGTKLNLDTSKAGDFAYVIVSYEGLEMNTIRYSVAGAANLSLDLEKSSEIQLKLSKSDYNPGDIIEMNIRSPYKGAGLITIEKDKVYAHKWFRASKNSSVQTIQIPKELEGNGYVTVTFTRSIDSNEIFMSPFTVGIAPFFINREQRKNKIELSTPELARPNQEFKVGYKSKFPGKMILFAVDEGILSVAKYKTPDPLSHFFKKKALEVKTWQILDLLLPEFSIIENMRSAQGGGSSALLGKNLNPFKRKTDKPVAFWSGVVSSSSKWKAWKFKLPDYFNGKLRVMALSVSETAMDAVSEQSFVKGYFVISPNMPTVLAPGDQAVISANVSNNVDGSPENAEVEINIEASENIEILGEKQQRLNVSYNSEAPIEFRIKAKSSLGNGYVQVKATHNGKSSSRKVTTSIRPASPYYVDVSLGVVAKNKAVQVETPRRTHKEFQKNEVTLSQIPLALSSGLSAYLTKYPYGCTEQILSKTVPVLAFMNQKDLALPKSKVIEQVSNVISDLRSREVPSGGFTAWPGSSQINYFHTAYAAHFITEVHDRNLVYGQDLLKSLLDYLQQFSEKPTEHLNMARVQAYAAYLLTRNQRLATKALANLDKWIKENPAVSWEGDLMALYMASAYKLMRAEGKAESLFRNFRGGVASATDYEFGIYDSVVQSSMTLYLMAKHFKDGLEDYNADKFQTLATALGRSFNTYSSAMAILAFSEYAKTLKGETLKNVKLAQTIQTKNIELSLPSKIIATKIFADNSESLQIVNSKSNLFYAVSQGGFDIIPNTKQKKQGIEIFRELTNKDGKPVTTVALGDELWVDINVRSITEDNIYNVAIVDLLPGAFEIVRDSIDRNSSWAKKFFYVDIREDRALLFTHLSKETNRYRYKIKANNRGRFQIPPIYMESMYDKNIKFLGEHSEITVN